MPGTKNEEIDEANDKLQMSNLSRLALNLIQPYITNRIDVIIAINVRRFRDGKLTDRLSLDAFAQIAELHNMLGEMERTVRNGIEAMETIQKQ